MANHAILIQNAVQAQNIDALNRSVESVDDVDNGSVLAITGVSVNSGEGEVFMATKPTTGALKLSLKLLGTTYVSIPDGTIGTQRVTSYRFEVVNNDSGLWMAYEPEVVTIVTASGKKFKGIDVDVRDFYNIANTPFAAFKPQVGDILTVSADGITGTIGANTFVVATNAQYAFAWATIAN